MTNVKERKKEFGKLLQEDVSGLGKGPGAGRDGVVGNFPEYVSFEAAN